MRSLKNVELVVKELVVKTSHLRIIGYIASLYSYFNISSLLKIFQFSDWGPMTPPYGYARA